MTGIKSNRIILYIIAVIVLTVAILYLPYNGCSRIPSHVGRANEVVVVSSVIDTNLIRNNLQLYNFVPQREELFKFVFVHDSLIDGYDKYHTLLLYGSLNDEFLNILLRDDAKATTQADTFALFKLDNLWARGQLAIILVASEENYVEQAVRKFQPLMIQILEENYYQKIKDLYYLKHISGRMKKRLSSYGFTLDLDKQWMIDTTYEDEGFIFVHTHFPDRSVFVYKEPYQGVLSDSFVLAKRDEITARFYNRDYVLKDLTTTDPIEFKNMKGIRARGVWQNDSLIAGGPFLSYFFVKDDTLIAIDGILFNPGERKSDYFTMLEVILNSLELTGSSE